MGEAAELELQTSIGITGERWWSTPEELRRMKIRMAYREKHNIFHRIPEWDEIPIEERAELCAER